MEKNAPAEEVTSNETKSMTAKKIFSFILF